MSPLFGPNPENILENGTPISGRIVGIAVSLTHDDPPVRLDEYAVEANGRSYGVRQHLAPADEVRLGMTVSLRADGDAAVIDWGEVDITRWKALKAPPAAGIDDDRVEENRGVLSKARKGGKGGSATILDFTVRSVAFGLGKALDARCRVEPTSGDPYEATIPKVAPPGYASHLLVVGGTLPVWEKSGLMGGSIVVDWPAAAMADPGIGRPPAARPDQSGPATSAMTMGDVPDAPADDDDDAGELPDAARKLMGKFGVTAPVSGSSPDTADVVPWETYLKIEHEIAWAELKKNAIEPFAVSLGVPPGEWPAAQRRWQERQATDPALAIAFGQAMSRP
jgi:hypothetical protein